MAENTYLRRESRRAEDSRAFLSSTANSFFRCRVCGRSGQNGAYFRDGVCFVCERGIAHAAGQTCLFEF